jgi:electron transfer flavoprotein alpha/beta subunit
MNIVVCVKYVPDAQAERTFNASDSTTDRVNVDGLLSSSTSMPSRRRSSSSRPRR